MKFTKTQTQVIVYEIILIFLGVVAVLRSPKPQAQTAVSEDDTVVSTVTVSSMYRAQKKSYSPAKPAVEESRGESVTITFDPEDSVSDKKTSYKKKKKYKTYRRRPAVKKVDYE